jgi:anti-anti-sigma factor
MEQGVLCATNTRIPCLSSWHAARSRVPFRAVSAAHLSVRKRIRQGHHVLTFHGEINGSTACQALERLAETLSQTRELVLDLSRVTLVDPFGLEVLSRGLSRVGRGRRIRIQASPDQLPLLASLMGGLVGV